LEVRDFIIFNHFKHVVGFTKVKSLASSLRVLEVDDFGDTILESLDSFLEFGEGLVESVKAFMFVVGFIFDSILADFADQISFSKVFVNASGCAYG